MTVFTVAQSKGGTTKTTTAAELVAELARRKRRVLALDCDQQGNLTTRLGVTRATTVSALMADVLTGEATAEEAAVDAPSVPGAQVIAGTQHLAQVEHMPEVGAALRDYLPSLTSWDDFVIDTPPALGVITLAALAAADVVIAPVTCEGEAYEQLDRLTRFITAKVTRLRPDQSVHAIVPTRFDGRRVLDREVIDLLNERYPGRVCPPIREGVVARDSYLSGQPVGIFGPRSGVAKDYATALAMILDQQPGRPNNSATN